MTKTSTALTSFDTKTWFKLWSRGETYLALLFILPSLLGFIIFFGVPAVRGLFISLTDWNLLQPASWKGFENYVTLFNDEDFWLAMKATAYYVILNIPLQTAVAVLMAVLMDRLSRSLFVRGVLVLPWLIPNVVVGLLWLWMLDPQLGLVNQAIQALGFERLGFLGSPELAMPSIAAINIWRHAGYTALLIFSGLQTIPKELYEASSIDGADERTAFFRITIPLLRPVLVFVLVTTVIGSFQIFDTIAITTKGGPIGVTRVLFWYIYEFAFARFKMGFAMSAAVVLFAILMVITLIQMRFLRANESDLGS